MAQCDECSEWYCDECVDLPDNIRDIKCSLSAITPYIFTSFISIYDNNHDSFRELHEWQHNLYECTVQ